MWDFPWGKFKPSDKSLPICWLFTSCPWDFMGCRLKTADLNSKQLNCAEGSLCVCEGRVSQRSISAIPGCGEWKGKLWWLWGGYGRLLPQISCFRDILGCKAEGLQDQRRILQGQHWAAPAQPLCSKSSSLLGLHLSSVATGTIPWSSLDAFSIIAGHDWSPLHLSCDIAYSDAIFACLHSPKPSARGLSPDLHPALA